MSVIDILTRVDALCKKYDKYDVDKQKADLTNTSGDQFLRLYTVIEEDIQAAEEKSNEAAGEKNRAAAVTLNAEVRRTKAALQKELPKLQKLALKKVKGLSKEELEARPDLVLGLAQRIEEIPDGTALSRRPANGGWAGGPRNEIRIDVTTPEDNLDPEHYEETEESKGFRSEYEYRKAKQDQGLDQIAEGIATLKYMAGDINEELDRQVPLIDEIDTKVDKATADLRNTNKRLKEVVTSMRSSRNFCIDIILLAIVLGIAAYLYK
ncbi:hypothetical protein R1sor_019164 [Riccia sorocarpa]|uniref:t-SNARE coiled-coil homology domain-containing protein n=1 Tax=Riccia sorocarpa TaxID=122646 RepID=A0ABD3IG01_9MARC